MGRNHDLLGETEDRRLELSVFEQHELDARRAVIEGQDAERCHALFCGFPYAPNLFIFQMDFKYNLATETKQTGLE